SILSYAPNSFPCGVGNSERRFIYSAAFCGATHSAVEHREGGVEAFRQQRVREDPIRHAGSQRAPLGSRSTLCRAAPRYILVGTPAATEPEVRLRPTGCRFCWAELKHE